MSCLLRSLLVVSVFLIGAAAAFADGYGTASKATQSKMKQMIYKEFGHGWLGETMIRCARRESGLTPWAANWHDSNGGSFGLFQINGIHRHHGESVNQFAHRMFIPSVNVASARALYRSGGLGPWRGGC